MRVYRRILASSTMLAGVPMGSSTNKLSSAVHIIKVILTCFGLPSVTPDTVFAICKTCLWDDLGNNFLVALAEGLSVLGVLATVTTLGAAPLMVVPAMVNIPLVVPTTARMFLMLACDMILILARAFTEAFNKSIGQPQKQDVEKAVLVYRNSCRVIHAKVKSLVPKGNVIKAYKIGDVEIGLRNIVEEYKDKVVTASDVGTPAAPFRNASPICRGKPTTVPPSRYSLDSAVVDLY